MGEPRHKRIRGATREVWGVLNPYGDVWGTDTFETPEAAKAFVADFWSNVTPMVDLSTFRVVKVRVRVTALPLKDQPGEAG